MDIKDVKLKIGRHICEPIELGEGIMMVQPKPNFQEIKERTERAKTYRSYERAIKIDTALRDREWLVDRLEEHTKLLEAIQLNAKLDGSPLTPLACEIVLAKVRPPKPKNE